MILCGGFLKPSLGCDAVLRHTAAIEIAQTRFKLRLSSLRLHRVGDAPLAAVFHLRFILLLIPAADVSGVCTAAPRSDDRNHNNA